MKLLGAKVALKLTNDSNSFEIISARLGDAISNAADEGLTQTKVPWANQAVYATIVGILKPLGYSVWKTMDGEQTATISWADPFDEADEAEKMALSGKWDRQVR